MTPYSYAGQRVVVSGAASGIGAATVELLAKLGAEIHAFDVQRVDGPVATARHVDIGDPGSIDSAIAAVGAPIHKLFNIAGVPHTHAPIDVMRVNFLGLRHLTERSIELMPKGGAVAHVASLAGAGWQQHLESINDLLDTRDFDAGLAWVRDHVDALGSAYEFSKECVIVYTRRQARAMKDRGLRINCISPGPVDTPMMRDFRAALGSDLIDWTAARAGRIGTPTDMAPALAFLNSNAAGYVNGVELQVDGGLSAMLATGTLD
jgi:NAD(P)-dependent dehydrogenase (short-subunit alcohol dehydrogenase family)